MSTESINALFASNLKRRMESAGLVQAQLAELSGVAQTSISNYLRPGDRKSGASGKAPSAKLTEMAMIAEALKVDAWEMLVPHGSDMGAETEKLALELLALFRAMPKNAQIAVLEQARVVHKATRTEPLKKPSGESSNSLHDGNQKAA